MGEMLTTLWALSNPTPPDLVAVADQHVAIADAIARRDGTAAADAMRRHLEFAPGADRGRAP
jgi:DNA-binding FadR family transcriptional regulator